MEAAVPATGAPAEAEVSAVAASGEEAGRPGKGGKGFVRRRERAAKQAQTQTQVPAEGEAAAEEQAKPKAQAQQQQPSKQGKGKSAAAATSTSTSTTELAEALRALAGRVETLERENAALRAENAKLKSGRSTGGSTTQPKVDGRAIMTKRKSPVLADLPASDFVVVRGKAILGPNTVVHTIRVVPSDKGEDTLRLFCQGTNGVLSNKLLDDIHCHPLCGPCSHCSTALTPEQLEAARKLATCPMCVRDAHPAPQPSTWISS